MTLLQSTLDAIIPDELRPNILLWLDEILLYAPSEEELLTSNQFFLAFAPKILSDSTRRGEYSTLP